MTSYNLFLDDVREPMDAFMYTHDKSYAVLDWIVVRNYDEFVRCIETMGVPSFVSFDHDLADIHYKHQSNISYDDFQEKTGYHCARWLIDYCLDNEISIPDVIEIHSMNPVGKMNIQSLFNTYNKIYNENT